RLLEFLEGLGELENTLIMVISDNGASSEGGPTGTTNEAQFFNNAQEPFEDSLAAIDEIGGPKHFNHYPWGWTFAGNTPFRRWKRETYRGGVSDPFIVSWPKGITATGGVREQYAHIIDMVPTVLDALGVEPPATIRGVTQSPLHGVSFAHTFDDAAAATRRTTQYFEMMGHRSIYHDGWRAVCPWPGPSFAEAGKGFGEPISAETLARLDAEGWELYHVAEDPAENNNVAAEHRDRLIALIATWYVEAGKYDVMPVDGSGVTRAAAEKPLIAAPRDRFVYYPGTQSVPFFAGPRVLNRPHSITADVEIPEAGAEGVLLAQGTSAGGFTFYVKDHRLHYTHNWVARELLDIESDAEVGAGRHALRFEFEPTGQPDLAHGHGVPGRLQLYIDGELTGDREVPYTTPFMFNPGALTCGADPGSAVTTEYQAPFRFTGTIHTVTVDLSGELISDPEAELKMHMARQ
ncbi:MAG: sulfatase-like hydrolase/transferase, partial [Solirubrobacteraceae bacterium]